MISQLREVLWHLLFSFRDNVGLFAISCLLAVGLWMFVVNEENPERTDEFPFALAVQAGNVPDDLAVFGPIDPVSIRVTAPEDVFNDLEVSDFQVVADLANASAGNVEVPVTVDYTGGRRGVDVVEVEPQRVLITLQPVVQRTLPVTVNVINGPPLGFSVGEISADPEEVRVTGPSDAVDLVDSINAEVDLSEVDVALESFETTVELVPSSEQGFTVVGVSLESTTADAVIEIVRDELSQTVPVVALVEGLPEAGFLVAAVEVDPATVVVTGPLDVLRTLDTLVTEPIDITGSAETITEAVQLDLPQGVTAEDTAVEVTVTIEASQGEATLGVAPTFINGAPGLTPTTTTALLLVRVRGPLNVLQSLSPDAIRAVIDLATLTAGTYTLTVTVELPEDIELIEVTPTEISVTLVAPATG
ncbi:MAG: CdaR family protein [Dehalococcoidia bacterium]